MSIFQSSSAEKCLFLKVVMQKSVNFKSSKAEKYQFFKICLKMFVNQNKVIFKTFKMSHWWINDMFNFWVVLLSCLSRRWFKTEWASVWLLFIVNKYTHILAYVWYHAHWVINCLSRYEQLKINDFRIQFAHFTLVTSTTPTTPFCILS